jgi:hypothetical protein
VLRQTALPFTENDQPIPVMFDFVHPICAGGRSGGEGGNEGFHETCWKFPARGHTGAIAAGSDQPQPSSCRENVVLPERAKKHKIAALTRLMISRGMFSRDHISTPSQLVAADHCCRSMSVTV